MIEDFPADRECETDDETAKLAKRGENNGEKVR